MPFGFGKRSCPGQAIAELQMLLFTVHLLRYEIIPFDLFVILGLTFILGNAMLKWIPGILC